MTWELQSTDITAAFLQGVPLEREVFLRPPPDVCSKSSVASSTMYVPYLRSE